MGTKYAIFGAGQYGQQALEEYGSENVECFIDNSIKESVKGSIPIISLDEYIQKKKKCQIIIATKYAKNIVKQLEDKGIYQYQIYIHDHCSYYPADMLVVNPYESKAEAVNEKMWNDIVQDNKVSEYIDLCVDRIKDENKLFRHVEIETYNRCNGGCEFCPVSIKQESRPECKMDERLFKKIINELEAINYDGRLALFSNNEPFLDERILNFHRYARSHVPRARMHLYTNGTKVSLEQFVEVMKYLDELIIDNYNEDLKLLPNCRVIKDYCERNPEYISRVTIVLRKPREILTNRGGDAPNRKEKVSYPNAKCILPFRQMIIRPDGKVSLCCNDPLGKHTLGDVTQDTLVNIWYNDKFNMIRKCLVKGRRNWKHCEYCDVFSVG
ncbi:MAG: SPASM domain-containing protein [Ruminococcus flavefaciens]|nr:SPASM domain-containing protein [Ruminococcus flavefaciens]